MDAMGYTKKNHRNSQKDLDPRPGVPNEYKLGQLLGKGAALSGRGPNPWERGKGKGRKVSQKKRQRQGQRGYQPRDTQST